jgi:hypothetical protein
MMSKYGLAGKVRGPFCAFCATQRDSLFAQNAPALLRVVKVQITL